MCAAADGTPDRHMHLSFQALLVQECAVSAASIIQERLSSGGKLDHCMQAGYGWVLQLEVISFIAPKGVLSLAVDIALLHNSTVLHCLQGVCNPAAMQEQVSEWQQHALAPQQQHCCQQCRNSLVRCSILLSASAKPGIASLHKACHGPIIAHAAFVGWTKVRSRVTHIALQLWYAFCSKHAWFSDTPALHRPIKMVCMHINAPIT